MCALILALLIVNPGTVPCLAPLPQRFKHEENDRMIWEALREKEQRDYWKLDYHVHRFGDTGSLMLEQISRIMRNENLDLAALRVEQILERVTDLRRCLTAQGRAYCTLPEFSGPSAEEYNKSLSQKQLALAEILDPEYGELAQTTKALTKLITALESGHADLQAARHAEKRLNELERQVSAFRELTLPPNAGDVLFIAWLRSILERQERESARYQQLKIESMRPLRQLIPDDK